MENLVGIFGILVLIFEIYRWLRKKWIERILGEKKKGKRPRKPQVMRTHYPLRHRFPSTNASLSTCWISVTY